MTATTSIRCLEMFFFPLLRNVCRRIYHFIDAVVVSDARTIQFP